MVASVPNVQSNARSTLISLVEEHVTSIVREAVSVQRHSKRARIHMKGETEQSGFIRRRLHADDINMALQWRGSEKIYATGTIGKESSEDNTVNLEDYLKSEMNIRPPQEVGLTVHWLAVDGVQPDIPQNMVPSSKNTKEIVRQVDEHVKDVDTGASAGGVQVTQLLPRLLSEELRLYFTRVTAAIERGGASPTTRQQQDAALAGIARDPGLQETVPFLVLYISKSLSTHLGNPEHCRTLVRMARALLTNPHIHLELHLHQLIPSLLTCIVAERLSSRPGENHWMLRKEAASTLVQVCNMFGGDYAMLEARVLKALCKAIGPDRSLSTQYGGFVAISLFGPNAINSFLLPLAVTYWKKWESQLEDTNIVEQRLELQMCQQAVLNAIGVLLGEGNGIAPEELEELGDTFGDRLVMLTSQETEFALCVI